MRSEAEKRGGGKGWAEVEKRRMKKRKEGEKERRMGKKKRIMLRKEGRRVRDKEMLTKKRKESTGGVCRRR